MYVCARFHGVFESVQKKKEIHLLANLEEDEAIVCINVQIVSFKLRKLIYVCVCVCGCVYLCDGGAWQVGGKLNMDKLFGNIVYLMVWNTYPVWYLPDVYGNGMYPDWYYYS